MSTTTTLQPGYLVWTKGANEYGDQRQGGAFIRSGHDPETGEGTVTFLSFCPATPRQPSLYLYDRKGYHPLGLLARLMRQPLSAIDLAATNDCPGYGKVVGYAMAALRASTFPPYDHLGSSRHTEMVHCYMVLAEAAQALRAPA